MKKVLIHTFFTGPNSIALEQRKYVPSIELAFRIARAFDVSLEDVFQHEETSK